MSTPSMKGGFNNPPNQLVLVTNRPDLLMHVLQ